jgi:hypothetical protein
MIFIHLEGRKFFSDKFLGRGPKKFENSCHKVYNVAKRFYKTITELLDSSQKDI